jgi:hypothetical protein
MAKAFASCLSRAKAASAIRVERAIRIRLPKQVAVRVQGIARPTWARFINLPPM